MSFNNFESNSIFSGHQNTKMHYYHVLLYIKKLFLFEATYCCTLA